MDSRFAIAWALSSALWAALLSCALLALERGRLLAPMAFALREEQRQYAAYRKLFGPPKDWADDRAVTVLYRTGQKLSYATGRDLALRGFVPAELKRDTPVPAEPPPMPKSERITRRLRKPN